MRLETQNSAKKGSKPVLREKTARDCVERGSKAEERKQIRDKQVLLWPRTKILSFKVLTSQI